MFPHTAAIYPASPSVSPWSPLHLQHLGGHDLCGVGVLDGEPSGRRASGFRYVVWLPFVLRLNPAVS